MPQNHKSVFSRRGFDAFEAINICNIIQRHGCDVFSVFVGKCSDKPYEIWAKYDTSDKLIEIDLEIRAFLNSHKTISYR